MTTKRIGLVTITQADDDLPWVLALAAHCHKLWVVVNSPNPMLGLAERITGLIDGPCTVDVVHFDLSQTEGQGRLTDFIRQQSPLHYVVNLYGHPLVITASSLSATLPTGENATFIDASMDDVLKMVRRDVDAILLLSQAVLTGMKQVKQGLLLQIFVGFAQDQLLAPFTEATTQFVEQFSAGLNEQLAMNYPQINVQYARYLPVSSPEDGVAILETPAVLLANALSAGNAS